MSDYSPYTAIPGAIPGIKWPPLNGSEATHMTVLCDQIEQSQWWEPEKMLAVQLRQIGKLCTLARDSTEFYKEILKDLPIDDEDGVSLEDFRKLPILKRSHLQDHFDELLSNDPSVERGPTIDNKSSGSTGEPITVRMSVFLNDMACVLQRRWYDWCGLDGNKSMAYLSSKLIKADQEAESYQNRWHMNFPEADYYINNVSLPLEEKMKWIEKVRPVYLTTYPSYISEMLKYAVKNNTDLSSLEAILVFGENYMEGLKELAEQVCGAKIFNKYASREFSCMALECPESGLYHVQSDNVYLEVLNDDGTATPEGGIGKVVATSLSNTAMPLIRYDIGDNAEVGPKCSCGRGLPTLSRILGRSRELIRLRDGGRLRPIINLEDQGAIAKLRKLQYVQTSYDDLIFKYVSDEPLSEEIEKRLIKSVNGMFPVSFNVTLERVDDIPRNAGGKYDDIKCEITE